MANETLKYLGIGLGIGIFILILVISILVSFGADINIKNAGSDNYGNMPEECKAPAGQDINSWKEHLGHHENTKYCLDYYK